MKATFQEGEEMRVYTVKDVDGTGQPEARETTSTKAKDASSAKQTAKKATPKPKAKVTAKSAGTSKTAAMGRQSPARQTAKRGAGRLKK
ncbi:hypothetical protein I302_100803 [Kwoniella bestiolae CBS 10118]|uniref:Uncharacterized protein n=1 Tax=Kwoniella bestiolae CBS 10118 TaxID=1296100 RepID=A0A1B9G661_9TREE|nr:hypothetical protein I302_04176 [Kwoniella bestiolae CBS 10118]OCF26490.1 hypothetical protein I302_04176 [Kwoniella bestiolae CBS 10118]